VAFSSKGDRIAWTLIEQMINGTYHKVAYYDTQTVNLTWLSLPKWIGDKAPQDRTIIIGNFFAQSLGAFFLFVCPQEEMPMDKNEELC